MMSDSSSGNVPSWLLKAKVMTPELVRDYLQRSSLLRKIESGLERRLTVLQAPAGFGKTTVLADVARRKQAEGVLVGWLSLDEDDTPSVVGNCLASAFEHASLDLTETQDLDAWSSSPSVHQIGMLARAIELHSAPCLLILDEVDRLPPRSVELVDRLIKLGPGNLRVAVAFRSNPGLDLATHVLNGSGSVVSTEQFRFSGADIARFFCGELSRRELIAVEERTAGWPVAVMVHRNVRASEAAGSAADTERLTSNYVAVRLLRYLPAEIRTDLMDLAVFDWIDADLVDEVLGSSDARLRVARQSALDGLLLPMDRRGAVRRLHPLVRDYCTDLLALENPVRKRGLHKRIAQAMAQRGHLMPACRHATAAGDSQLAGEFIETAGVFQMWLRGGPSRLLAMDRFLTPQVTALYPRCALLRSVVLRLKLRVEEARAQYASVSRATGDFSRDRDGGDADALAVDRIFTQAVLAGGSGQLLGGEFDKMRTAGGPDAASPVRDQGRHTLLCASHFERASFGESRRSGILARASFNDEMRYGNVFVNIHLGMSAMAQGRVREATEHYAAARQGTKRYLSSDPCLAVWVDAVKIELDLERNRRKAIRQRTLTGLAALRGAWTSVYAVPAAVSAELMSMQYGQESAIQLLTRALDDARPARDESLSRYLAGLLAFYLVEGGRPGQAARLWRDHALPDEAAALLDLERQPWRTMEAISCARIRLLADQGEFAAGEALAQSLCRVASERGLIRTLFRGLALAMLVAQRAGEPDRVQELLVEYLRRVREVDYVRPLARYGAVSRTALTRLLDTAPGPAMREAAESVLSHLGGTTNTGTVFSARERWVLAEVGRGRRNGEIATLLKISEGGVRYHLRNIYRKTGVTRRRDLVTKAPSLGVPG